MGGITHNYEIGSSVADTAVINSFGQGNVSTGLELDNGFGGSMNMVVSGQIRHDPVERLPAYGHISANGQISGQLGTGSANSHYAHAGWFGRINPDGSIEGPDGPVSPSEDAAE